MGARGSSRLAEVLLAAHDEEILLDERGRVTAARLRRIARCPQARPPAGRLVRRRRRRLRVASGRLSLEHAGTVLLWPFHVAPAAARHVAATALLCCCGQAGVP